MLKNALDKNFSGDNIILVRARNRATVFEIILRNPGICRRDIVARTGLAAGAVTDITRELINEGFVNETDSAPRESRVGRQPIGLAVEENAVWAVGALIDRKTVTVGLCNLLGQLVFSKEAHGDFSSVENAQQTLTNLVKEALDYASSANTTVIGMGVSIPGMVMRDSGAVRYSAILDWQDVMLAKRLEAEIPLSVVIDNDVRGMALAQHWFREQPHADFLMVYLGQGIACCPVQNGRIWAGSSGAAGQIGHTIIDPNGPECVCGNKGCFETVISVDRLMEMMVEEMEQGAVCSASKEQLRKKDISTEIIRALLEEGDDAARTALPRMSKYFGIGLSNLIKTYDPQALILAGDLFSRSKFAADLVKREMYSYFLHQQISPDILIDNDPYTRLIGSAAIALDYFVYRPASNT